MTVRVLLFSVLCEEVGSSEFEVELSAPATGEALLDRLSEEHAAVARFRSTLRLAVNEAFCSTEAALHDGDEVALITPVSGG